MVSKASKVNRGEGRGGVERRLTQNWSLLSLKKTKKTDVCQHAAGVQPMLQILYFVFREINILSRKTSSDPPKTISALGGSDDAPRIGAEMSKYAAKVKKKTKT